MYIDYRNKKTQKKCEIREYALKLYSEKVVDQLNKLLYKLRAEDSFAVFRSKKINQTYRIHELKGEKEGLISLSLDNRYRMTIKVLDENIDGQDKIIIWEVSNHYGD